MHAYHKRGRLSAGTHHRAPRKAAQAMTVRRRPWVLRRPTKQVWFLFLGLPHPKMLWANRGMGYPKQKMGVLRFTISKAPYFNQFPQIPGGSAFYSLRGTREFSRMPADFGFVFWWGAQKNKCFGCTPTNKCILCALTVEFGDAVRRLYFSVPSGYLDGVEHAGFI